MQIYTHLKVYKVATSLKKFCSNPSGEFSSFFFLSLKK